MSYPYNFSINCVYQDLINGTSLLKPHENNPDKLFNVQCRVLARRDASGKLVFMTVDVLNGENLSSNSFQIAISKNLLVDENHMALCHKIKLGDVIGVTGFLGKTKMGEPTIFAKSLTILAPCLHEIPKATYSDITDIDVKYRQRYLDMIINSQTRYNLITRSKVIRYLRDMMNNQGFLEVETPIMHTNYGGANAEPFVTTHNALKREMYMRISPELFLKQLVIGGMNKIYEIGKQFRNESINSTHSPEFSSMECYQTPADYNTMLDLCENIFREIVFKVHGSLQIKYKDTVVDFEPKFRTIDFLDALREKTGYAFIDLESQQTLGDVKELIAKYKIKCHPLTMTKMLDKLIGHFVEPECVQPTFIIHHPKIMSPLAKPHRLNPELTERFELFIMNHEYANAYTELNIPHIQKDAFMKQATDYSNGNVEAQPTDMDFVKALEYGLPPTGGLGIGIDRFVMLLLNQQTIREVLCFPTMKPLTTLMSEQMKPSKNEHEQLAEIKQTSL